MLGNNIIAKRLNTAAELFIRCTCIIYYNQTNYNRSLLYISYGTTNTTTEPCNNKKKKIYMDRSSHYMSSPLFLSITIASSLISFALCIASEFKKSDKSDIRLDAKLCTVPGSPAYELGIGAIICLCISQLIGSIFVCRKSHYSSEIRKPTVLCSLLGLSWISFGIAVIMISTATSMNKGQALGEGWLDKECYLVKDGVFIGSALLILLALGSNLGSAAMYQIRPRLGEEDNMSKVHVKMGK